MQKYRVFQLRIGDQVIDPKTRLETYRVERVDGPRLWLHAVELNGWVATDQVVPIEQAIEFFTKYIQAHPADSYGFSMRSKIWNEEKKELDLALGDVNEAIRLDPTKAYIYINRAVIWNDKNEYDKAIADCNEAIRLDPNFAHACSGRAWLWATCPHARFRDGKKAVESATKACELSAWKNRNYLVTLAAACAEAGDFAAAARWQSKVIDLLTDDKEKQANRSLLKLYQKKKPYRETQP